MNYFILLVSLLYLGGSFIEITNGDFKKAIIFICYSVANYLLIKM